MLAPQAALAMQLPPAAAVQAHNRLMMMQNGAGNGALPPRPMTAPIAVIAADLSSANRANASVHEQRPSAPPTVPAGTSQSPTVGAPAAAAPPSATEQLRQAAAAASPTPQRPFDVRVSPARELAGGSGSGPALGRIASASPPIASATTGAPPAASVSSDGARAAAVARSPTHSS
jgi:hypothetical protein